MWFQVVTESSSYTLIKATTPYLVVGYKGFETMENYKTVSPKFVVVVYENSNYKALFGKCGVLGL